MNTRILLCRRILDQGYAFTLCFLCVVAKRLSPHVARAPVGPRRHRCRSRRHSFVEPTKQFEVHLCLLCWFCCRRRRRRDRRSWIRCFLDYSLLESKSSQTLNYLFFWIFGFHSVSGAGSYTQPYRNDDVRAALKRCRRSPLRRGIFFSELPVIAAAYRHRHRSHSFCD